MKVNVKNRSKMAIINALGQVPGREEGTPPPAVVLVAELEVAHDDGDLCARHHQDDQHHKQKPEDEIDL